MTRSSPFWGGRTGTTSTTPVAIYLPAGWREVKLWVDALSYAQLGTTYTAPAVADVNGVTTITSRGTPTAGTFKLTAFPNDATPFTTATIAYNDSAANVKTALIAGSTRFVTGDITAAGGALPTDITLTWTGVYATTVPFIVPSSVSVTGGDILVRTTTQPIAHGGYGYVAANTQETWANDQFSGGESYLYVATVSGTGNYQITCYA